MASNQQPYGYPPPPPPPPTQSGTPQNAYTPYNSQQNNYGQPHQNNGRGRGGGGRGRAGSFVGRGDFHSSAQYNPQAGGYNAPGGYGAPAAVNGGYGTQNSASYGPQPPASGYPSAPPQPQWQHEQQHHSQAQAQVAVAPPPIPLSAQNYHPNYAPQVYQSQPTVYGQPQQQNSQPPQQPPLHQQQPPQFQNSPQPQSSFAHSTQPPLAGGPPLQHWGAPTSHSQAPQFNGGRGGRGRGGSYQGRGGFEAPLMGPPIRMGFDNDHIPQASNNGFPPYATSQHGSPPLNLSSPSPSYQNNQNGYRSQDYSQRGRGGRGGGYRAPLDPNPFYGNDNRGGRGGFTNYRGNFSSRGNRGDMHSNGFKPRFNPNFKNFSDNRSHSASESAGDLSSQPGITGIDGKKKKQKKKRKTNTLGLTPGLGDDSGTEDDTDEENRLAPLVMSAASLPTDLQAWLAERKKKWPTAAIREAKAAELAKRLAQAREQSARDKAKALKEREERAALEAKLAEVQKGSKDSKKSKKNDGESKLERQRRKAEKLRKQLEKAEKKVQSAMQAGLKRKRDVNDEGDDAIKLEDQSDDKLLAQAEDGDSSSDDSDSSDSDSDDQSEPEAQSSRKNQGDWNFKPHPLLHTKPCKYFSSGGTCGKMNKCRFIHDQAARDASLKERARDGGRVSLAELLKQNEQDKENLTVLKAIQYVAENGLLDEPQQPQPATSGQTDEQKVDAVTSEGGDQAKAEASDNGGNADNHHEAMTDV